MLSGIQISAPTNVSAPTLESTSLVIAQYRPLCARYADAYPSLDVAGLLSDASEQEIVEYQQALKKMRKRTSVDLQQNVYQNRTQFIKISKEAEKLKGEMRALRNLMSELKTNTTALRAASTTDPAGFDESFPSTLSKRDKRSSVADRTAMWNSQLQV
jgi:hypothetical protein